MQAACHYELPETFRYRGWSIRYRSGNPEEKFDVQLMKTWVIFVHGTPWCSDVFRPVITALEATGRFHTVLYDLPGYGQSQTFANNMVQPEDGPDTSVKAQGEIFAAFLTYMGRDGMDRGPRAHIIAHDIAGVIAMRAHLLHGCEYQSLCLLDTNCVLPWGDELYNLVRSNPDVFKELPDQVFEGALRAIIKSARFDNPQVSFIDSDLLSWHIPWKWDFEHSFVHLSLRDI